MILKNQTQGARFSVRQRVPVIITTSTPSHPTRLQESRTADRWVLVTTLGLEKKPLVAIGYNL